MRRALATVVGLVALAEASAAPAARLPSVLTQRTPTFQVRPAVISYTGDGTGIIGGTDGTSARHPGRLRWTTYSQREGRARGLVWLDDCTPSCAEGTFRATPVAVHVFSPSAGHFRRLTLSYTFQGKHYTDRRRARHFGGNGMPGYWAYDIVAG